MSRIEVFVGHVEKGVVPWAMTDKIHEAMTEKGDSKIDVVNQRGQVIASITSVAQLVFQNIAHVQIANMNAHYTVATLTSGKILLDLKQGHGVEVDDVLSLVGNVSGIVGSFAALTARASPKGVMLLTAISLSGDVYSLVNKHVSKLEYFYKRAVDAMIDSGREEGYIDKDALIVPPGGSGTFAVFNTDEGDYFQWWETVIGGAFSSPLPSNNPGASPGYDAQHEVASPGGDGDGGGDGGGGGGAVGGGGWDDPWSPPDSGGGSWGGGGSSGGGSNGGGSGGYDGGTIVVEAEAPSQEEIDNYIKYGCDDPYY